MKKSFLFKSLVLLSLIFVQPVYAESGTVVNSSGILVNLNTADAEQLQTMLFGVGSSKAQAIVAYRDQHGDFESVEQLLNVSGIGIRTLEENRPLLTVESN